MLIDTQRTVTMTEANQNFSRVAKMASAGGPVVIMRNNAPAYTVAAVTDDTDTVMDAKLVETLVDKIIAEYRPALKLLAE